MNINISELNPSTLQDEGDASFSHSIEQSKVSKRTRKPTQKMAEYICRLCELNSYNLIKIFSAQGNQLKLADKIHFHLAIKVTRTDKLPLAICALCVNALNVCNDLYQKSLSADSNLRKIFLNENQTTLQSVESLEKLQPKTFSNAIPSSSKDSDLSETQIIDAPLVQSNLPVPKSKSKGNKKASSETKAAEIPAHSKEKIKKPELPKILDNSGDSVEADAATVLSEDEEENLWGQDDDENNSTKESTYTCDLCPEVFGKRAELSIHRKTHPPEERLRCHCGKVMPNDGSFQTHQKTHTFTAHPCHICGKILASTSGLRAHILAHGNPKFCCEICGKSTHTLAKLQSHKASHSDERPFSCEVCGQSFKLKCTLKQHAFTHNERRQFVCEICGHAVNRQSHLKNHMRSHQAKDYKLKLLHSCSKCSLKFSTKNMLKKHCFRVHGEGEWGELPECPIDLVCTICSVKFPTPSEYGAHIKACAKGYKCGFCDRVLASQRSLQIHLRGHTGECPFSCKFCDKLFKSEMSRDLHQRVHTGERPYQCPKCDKAFRSITNLYQHKATHDPVRKYLCPHCQYKTHRPAALRVHLRVHTGEKPYSCDTCGKSYKSSWDLKLHSETHLGIRRPRRIREKQKTKIQNLVLTESSESVDLIDAACANENAVKALLLADNV
ncbi:zinc finger protein 2 homolog [Thrips palmi]|uniref:Zinc finger protein 2 homolog n=1 Tax=Thrips palmi TaxID=161013 RepID=A0A6P8ZU35_THRPL|nr:zinc finger protein 2 homolog [Thrips palmi]XP_034248729.1 zinc finger protein 2 homolog [Thrips palmi]XP_034248730.1 zinc finger protein 2 homolog [Thrips palmi]